MSEWRLLGEHAARARDADVPDELRPLLRGRALGDVMLVLRDPALPRGHNWLPMKLSVGPDPIRFLEGTTDDTPRMIRYYIPSTDGTGFRAELGRTEGHWRLSTDEPSELPWPAPVPSWFARGVFLVQLDGVELRAARIAYRGFSYCRLCGRENGHEALRLGCWQWPAGFRHYVADHLVRPTDAFVDFVRATERR